MDRSTHHIARVAVPAPLHGLFDYLIPDGNRGMLEPGCRVRVPFGRREMIGIVVDTSDHSGFEKKRLRALTEVIDDVPCLPDETRELLDWAARYYHHPVGEVYSNALPSLLRSGDPDSPQQIPVWALSPGTDVDESALQKRAPKQWQLYRHLSLSGEQDSAQLNEQFENWRPAMKALLDKHIAERRQRELIPPANETPDPGPELLDEQSQAVAAISASLDHQVHLLYGVTGSGKTEVYIQLASRCLERGQQVLLLVPEIGLTPQLTTRLRSRLACRIGVMHSSMNDMSRHNIWHHAANGSIDMVIGTRSAVFTPMPDLGLIIIDEEHDASFKQQDGFRYHARDLGIVRAKLSNIPVVLGSATPSLESLHNSRQDRYQCHRLNQRAASPHMTRYELVDMRRQPVHEGLSHQLISNVETHLERGDQVMLFINRRGYAPLLMCHDCGWTTNCPRCDAHMTYHQHNDRLRCHHCDSVQIAPSSCQSCGSDELIALGTGTERVEQYLQQRFPDVGLVRLDRDTTRQKGALESKLDDIRSGEARILIGTQMLAKGHDFPDVTLVGIIDTDQALYSVDFRASEHLAQLVIQVSGRAGRGDKPGEVMLQTHHPDHPLLQTLLHHGFDAFSDSAITERSAACLPPFSYMVLLRCEAHDPGRSDTFMREAMGSLSSARVDPVQLFGPVAAPMERRAGRYRSQIIIQSDDRRALHELLTRTLPGIASARSASAVRWSLDVDPIDTY